MRGMPQAGVLPFPRPRWQRALWLLAEGCCLLTGVVGIFLPLLPTTPFVRLTALCFSRGSLRCETWLLNDPRFGPTVRDWRAHRAIGLQSKPLATLMMAVGLAWAWQSMPQSIAWLPAVLCAAVAAWMWNPPTAAPRRPAPSGRAD